MKTNEHTLIFLIRHLAIKKVRNMVIIGGGCVRFCPIFFFLVHLVFNEKDPSTVPMRC